MDAEQTGAGQAGGLGDYATALVRRWWVVAIAAVLCVAAALAFTAVQTKKYTASSSVLVLAAGTSGSGSNVGRSVEVNLDTEAEIVTSAAVAGAVKEELGTTEAVPALLSRVSVSVPPNSQVLVIDFVGNDARSAQLGAQSFAETYLAQRAAAAKADVDSTVERLRERLATLSTQLRAATDKLATLPPNSPDSALAEEQRSLVVAEISNINNTLVGLESAPITPGQVITAAGLPSAPSAPSLPLNLAAGLALGLLVGALLAITLDRNDHRVRRGGDVERKVGLPLLATLPRSASAELASTEDDEVDRLRLALLAEDARRRLVQVSDPSSHRAGSRVAVALAHSLHRAFDDVVLVVATSDSEVPRWTGTTDAPGLVEVLRGEAALADVLVEVPELPGVRLLPPGREPEALRGLLQSAAMSELLETLRTSGMRYRFGALGLIDRPFDGRGVPHASVERGPSGSTAPPALPPAQAVGTAPPIVVETDSTGRSAGAAAVAALSDVVLLAADGGSADARLLEAAAEGAAVVGGVVAGVVLVTGRGTDRGLPALVRRRTPPPATRVPEARSQERPAAPAPAPAAAPARVGDVEDPVPGPRPAGARADVRQPAARA